MRLITLIASLFIALNTYAGQLQPQRYFENNGGLVDHLSPLLIPEKNASALQNVTLDDRGQLTKRNGYTLTNTTGALTTSAVTGGGYHNATTGSSFFAVVIGTNVYRTSNSFGGTYSVITGTVTITSSASNLAQSTSLNDSLVFCNESDRPFRVASTGNAFALAPSSAPAQAKTCATYGNYLVLGNTTESSVSYPSRVRWSNINSTEDWPTNNYIDVEPNDGDKVVALVTYEDSTYIFKKRAIYKMVITGSPGADAFIITPISRNIGAWAKNSVRIIPGVGITFLAQNTIYLFDGNELTPIGDPIQRTFDNVSRSQWANAVASVYPKRYQYWLAVSTNSTSNTQVLVYDYIQRAWSVYTNMTVNMLSQAEDSTGANVLLSGDITGNVFKQDNGTVDFPLGVTSAIPASYTTADLTMNSPEITKNFKYLYVFTNVDLTTTLIINKGYEYSSIYESSSTINLGQTGAQYDVALYDQDVFPSTQYRTTRIELNRSARSMKLQFMNNDSNGILGVIGWVIVYSLEDWKE